MQSYVFGIICCIVLTSQLQNVLCDIEVRFCDTFDDITSNSLSSVPKNETKEHWDEWNLSKTEFSVDWHPTEDISNANITSYVVALKTNYAFINSLLSFIGGFPQDLCAANSRILDFTSTGGRRPQACGLYTNTGSRRTSFSIPAILRFVIDYNNVVVTSRGYGTYRSMNADGTFDDPSSEKSCTFWCFQMRRKEKEATNKAIDTEVLEKSVML
eukprot:gene7856-16078_t